MSMHASMRTQNIGGGVRWWCVHTPHIAPIPDTLQYMHALFTGTAACQQERSDSSSGFGKRPIAAKRTLPRQANLEYDARMLRRNDRLRERAASRSDPAAAEAAVRARLRPITHRQGGPTLPPRLEAALPTSALFRCEGCVPCRAVPCHAHAL